jgi:hypothetical protein
MPVICFCGGMGVMVVGSTYTEVRRGTGEVQRYRTAPPCVVADLNCDGAVNGFDLVLLLGAWG